MAKSELYNKRRLACDRCHSQKSRCPKSAESGTCTRCLRASVPCLYSQSLRGTRAKSTGRQWLEDLCEGEQSATLNGTGTTSAMTKCTFPPRDWLDAPDLGMGLADYTSVNQRLGINGRDPQILVGLDDFPVDISIPSIDWATRNQPSVPGLSMTHTTSTEDTDPNSRGSQQDSTDESKSATERLALLTAAISKNMDQLPAPSLELYMRYSPEYFHPRLETDPIAVSDVLPPIKYSFDDTLQLTQSLLDMFASVSQPETDPATTTSPLFTGSGIDLAYVYLLLSCTHRLLDIWDLNLEHMRILQSLGRLDCGGRARSTLSVGQFTAKNGTASKMMTALVSTLLVDLKEAIERFVSLVRAGGSAKQLGKDSLSFSKAESNMETVVGPCCRLLTRAKGSVVQFEELQRSLNYKAASELHGLEN